MSFTDPWVQVLLHLVTGALVSFGVVAAVKGLLRTYVAYRLPKQVWHSVLKCMSGALGAISGMLVDFAPTSPLGLATKVALGLVGGLFNTYIVEAVLKRTRKLRGEQTDDDTPTQVEDGCGHEK